MPTQPGTVLVVDDTELNRLLLSSQLTKQGFSVHVAENGRQALALLQTVQIDLVLLDLMMPEVDGFEVLEQMRQSSTLQRIPVIVISALDEMEHVVRCIEMGAADLLTKPFDPVLLRARIKASLEAKQLHDQEAEYLRQVTYLTHAASEVEAGSFDPATLQALTARPDELGQLARVFQSMAREVDARERHLQQQSQFKSALIGKITHELRSPFVAADFSVQLLDRYVEHNMISELRTQIQQLQRQLAQGRQMIDGVISFASLVGKQIKPQLEEIDPALLIADAVAPLKVLAATRKVELRYDIAEPLPRVRLDSQQIGEAIHHLVHNAVRFSKAGDSVTISCWATEGQLIVRVEDTGCGIEPEKLEAIWNSFAQSADDVQRGVEGLGLGLPLVKYVVEAHRGEVVGRSKPGEGSVFGFRIPLMV